MEAVDRFMPLINEAEEDESMANPVMTDDGVSYLYIKHNNLYCKIN